jgi:hypothetical protein
MMMVRMEAVVYGPHIHTHTHTHTQQAAGNPRYAVNLVNLPEESEGAW